MDLIIKTMDFIKLHFKNEEAYQNSIRKVINTNFKIFENLEKSYGSAFNKPSKVDFSFISNSKEKLESLSKLLGEKYNSVKSDYGLIENNLHLMKWSITEKKVELEEINNWVLELLLYGKEHDCVFNGWGVFSE